MTIPDGGDDPEPVVVSHQHWELGANLADLSRSALAWRKLGDAAQQRADNLVAGFAGLLATDWSGRARDSFEQNHQRLVEALDEVRAQAHAAADEVDAIADLVRVHQESLSSSRSTLQATVPSTLDPSEPGGAIVFFPGDGDEVAAIQAATEEADLIREEFGSALATYSYRFGTSDWEALESMWEEPPEMGPFIPTVPNDPATTSQLWVDGRVVLNTGGGSDRVTVTVDPRTGQVRVDVNGTSYEYPPGTPITIRTGAGNDVIEVDGAVTLDLVLLGGTGNNRLQGGSGDDLILGGAGKDDLLGGAGADYLSGGAGADYLDGQDGDDRLSGGLGNDTVYGLAGADYLAGGDGDDYLEGGRDGDTIDGGTGRDAISGGRGDDTLRGGAGRDVLYAGHGQDTLDGGSGWDTGHRQDGDRTTNLATDLRVEVTDGAGFITVEGSPDFVARVEADLDLLRASPTGQQVLAELAELRDPNAWPGQRNLTIRELAYDPDEGYPNQEHGQGENGYAHEGGWALFGNRDSAVDYNPTYTGSHGGRPVTVLYHELAHIYSYWNGNHDDDLIAGGVDDGVRKLERQAVGLPYDHDGDPQTPDRTDPQQPLPYTENGLRGELGLAPRERYR